MSFTHHPGQINDTSYMNLAVHIAKIEYKGETRIQVLLPYQPEYLSKIKTIMGCRWSATLKCWHVPYSSEAYRQLKSLFPQLIVTEASQEADTGSTTRTPIRMPNGGETALATHAATWVSPKRVEG